MPVAFKPVFSSLIWFLGEGIKCILVYVLTFLTDFHNGECIHLLTLGNIIYTSRLVHFYNEASDVNSRDNLDCTVRKYDEKFHCPPDHMTQRTKVSLWRKEFVNCVYTVQKPNSWTYNFLEVSGHDLILRALKLEVSVYTIFTLQTNFKPLLLGGGGGGVVKTVFRCYC